MNGIGPKRPKNVELASKKAEKMMTSGGFEPGPLQTKDFLNPVPYPLGHRAHIQKGHENSLRIGLV